ncbi:MAG: NAD(P)H-dependent oxidoreductase [Bacteroidetes bacterium GWF2_41_61]|jgi:nitroreductase|nr:MAG: NAD(P)H-dependent oxidoreductase [Bacteroidetes bacterium GWF2_41_61]OFY90638.1 MAG: NAD(P)H-dependent oxidoreductase [Bacteroidetes bacterium RIFOXYA12_FULL_40_10]PKP07251.1 MAG: NAD(P)H-dependent oxidoreductase [Bacteroidetes bacterium HGW-Bacteroidetes-5]HBG24133.1 NAD(P)H-dependent oxidoreductase [Rikenellaceae bacterium]
MNIIDNLKWRYATKKFDTTKKVSAENLELLKEAVNLSASSYGLQPFKILIIENPEIREKLRAAAWGQPQITDSSHLLLFCNYLEVGPEKVDGYLKLRADINNLKLEDSKDYGDMMKSLMVALTPEQMEVWTSKQTYIALGTLLAAAAELKIDSCPMEGFDKVEFNKILGLNEKGLSASVIGAVGYRSQDDPYVVFKKVRKPLAELFETI